jgi:hypothetical protein
MSLQPTVYAFTGDDPIGDPKAFVEGMRQQGFDRRRTMFLAYLIRFHANHDAALTASENAESEGWDGAVFADRTGWVVRLSHKSLVTVERLREDGDYVRTLARLHQARWDAVSVEDLLSTETVWDRLGRPPASSGTGDVDIPSGAQPSHRSQQHR